MTENLIHEDRLAEITLAKGAHGTPKQGLCLMEAVAYVRGISHTDKPPCVSPALGAFGRKLNDMLPDDLRQELKPLIVKLPGTAGDGKDERRGFMSANWAVRVLLPVILDEAGLAENAQELRDLAPGADMPMVRLARSASAAAAAAAAAYASSAAASAAYASSAASAAASAASAAALRTRIHRMSIEFFIQLIDRDL